MDLYALLQTTANELDSTKILLTVSLSDLRQFAIDTIEETRRQLFPLYLKQEEDGLIPKSKVCEMLGIKNTSVWNLVKKGKLEVITVNGARRYRKSDVIALIESSAK